MAVWQVLGELDSFGLRSDFLSYFHLCDVQDPQEFPSSWNSLPHRRRVLSSCPPAVSEPSAGRRLWEGVQHSVPGGRPFLALSCCPCTCVTRVCLSHLKTAIQSHQLDPRCCSQRSFSAGRGVTCSGSFLAACPGGKLVKCCYYGNLFSDWSQFVIFKSISQ